MFVTCSPILNIFYDQMVEVYIHGVSEKTVQNCFYQKFVKYPSILIIFGRQMAKWLKFYATYKFSTSSHSCYRTTLLITTVPNFTVSHGNWEKMLSELYPISIKLITFGRYMTK